MCAGTGIWKQNNKEISTVEFLPQNLILISHQTQYDMQHMHSHKTSDRSCELHTYTTTVKYNIVFAVATPNTNIFLSCLLHAACLSFTWYVCLHSQTTSYVFIIRFCISLTIIIIRFTQGICEMRKYSVWNKIKVNAIVHTVCTNILYECVYIYRHGKHFKYLLLLN